jgi:hypothetical protein
VAELENFFPPADTLSLLWNDGEYRAAVPRPLQEVLRSKIGKARTRARLDLVAQKNCEIPRALEEIKSAPLRWTGAILQRVYLFWGPNSFLLRSVNEGAYRNGPLADYRLVKWPVVLSYVGIMLAALLALGRRSLPPVVELSALFAVFNCAAYSASQSNSRYRLPIMLFVMAMASIWLARPCWPEGRLRQSAVGLLLIVFLALSVHYVATVLP